MVPQACTSYSEAELFGPSTPLAEHGRSSSSSTWSESPTTAPPSTAVDSGSHLPASPILGKHRRSSNVDDDDDDLHYHIDGRAAGEGALSTVHGIDINDARSTHDAGVGGGALRRGSIGSDGTGGRSCRGDRGSLGEVGVGGRGGGAAEGSSAQGLPKEPQPKRRCRGLHDSHQAREPLVIGPSVLGGGASGAGKSNDDTGVGGEDAGGAEGARGEGGGNQLPGREERHEDLKAAADIL